MFQRIDLPLVGYTLLSLWMGVLLFHVVVVIPSATRVLPRDKLGEFSLSVQGSFHTWGIVLTAISSLLLILGGETSGALLSSVVFASVLFSEYLRRRVRALLKRYREERSDSLKGEILGIYRFVAYATYTQVVAGLGALAIGWLRL